MGTRLQLAMKAWTIPLLLVVIVIPGSAAMAFLGPGVGLALGQLTITAIVLATALRKPDTPLEVASSTDGRHRMLVLATETIEGPAVDRIAVAAEGSRGEDPAVVRVLAPARTGALSEWLSDVEPGRDRAQVLLVHSVAALAATGVEAEAKVGDADIYQAVEDELRSFPADELIAVTAPDEDDQGAAKALGQLETRLPIPFARTSTRKPAPAAAARG